MKSNVVNSTGDAERRSLHSRRSQRTITLRHTYRWSGSVLFLKLRRHLSKVEERRAVGLTIFRRFLGRAVYQQVTPAPAEKTYWHHRDGDPYMQQQRARTRDHCLGDFAGIGEVNEFLPEEE